MNAQESDQSISRRNSLGAPKCGLEAAFLGLHKLGSNVSMIGVRLSNKATISNPLQLIIVALLGSLLTAYVFGPFYSNAWSIIDDHEIFRWLGTQDKLPLSDFLSALGQTEVLDPTVTTRFRPIYYIFRILETTFFGKKVALWYTSHTLIYFVAVSIFIYIGIFRIARNWPERLVIASGLLLLCGRTYWADIFARLGPAESYGMLGVAIAALGYTHALAEDEPKSRWYGLIMIGSLVAAGSKENLLVFVIPLLVLTVSRWKRCSCPLRVSLLLTIGLLISDAAYVAAIAGHAGQDLYGNPTSLNERLRVFAAFLNDPTASALVAITVLGSIGMLLRHLSEARPDVLERESLKLLWLLATCLFVSASQYAFYAGKLPANSRYDFPYRTALDLAIITINVAFLRIGRDLGRTHYVKVAATGAAFVIAVFVAVIGVAGIKNNRGHVFWTRELNLVFARKFDEALQKIGHDRISAIVLSVHRGPAYEPILSIGRQLSARALNLPIYLIVDDGYEQPSDNAWYKGLSAQIRNWSLRGHEAIAPLVQPLPKGDCFSFGFNGSPHPSCRGVVIWPITKD